MDVPGYEIDSHLKDIEVGETEAIQGSIEGITYNIWMMKEPDYIMKMMVETLLQIKHVIQQADAGWLAV